MLAAVFSLNGSPPAHAAGGAHVIDDSEVETPGSCHVETSVSRLGDDAGVLVVSPGCTMSSLANLEIGASASRSWDLGGRDFKIGPALKWNLRSFTSGFGVAIDASASWSSTDQRIDAASVIVPITVVLGEGVDFNTNAGIIWARTDNTARGFFGSQVVWQKRTNLQFMAEAFERINDDPGSQVGVRWNPDEKTDVDFLVSHDFNGTPHMNATFGITQRF